MDDSPPDLNLSSIQPASENLMTMISDSSKFSFRKKYLLAKKLSKSEKHLLLGKN